MKALDDVAILEDLPANHLRKGQVGTIVEMLGSGMYLIEFADLDGVAYEIEPVSGDKLIELRHAPAMVA